MIQELVFTTLPNQRVEKNGKKFLKASVFVTPHIKGIGDVRLGSAPDMFNWAEKIAATQFAFRINGKEIPAEFNASTIDKELYHNIFHKDIQLEKFDISKIVPKQIQSFPVKHISDFLLEQVKQVGVESPRKLPPADYFIDPDRLGIISKIQLNPQAAKLADDEKAQQPVTVKSLLLKNDTEMKQVRMELKNNLFIPFDKMAAPKRDFAQFSDFHAPERLKNKIPLEIKKPTFEFHDIISVLHNYPDLMRMLGFILDFTIPYDSAIAANGAIQLVPLNLQLTETNTKISIPATAYTITDKGFYAADKSDSSFKNGFVKVNTPDFTVVQIDTDGMALKTAQTVDRKMLEAAKFFESRSIQRINPAAFSAINNTQNSNDAGGKDKKANFSKTNIALNRNIGSMAAAANSGKTLRLQKMRPLERVKLIEPPNHAGLPTMRTAGIALIHNGMSSHVAERVQRNLDFQNLLIDKAAIDKKISKLILPQELLYSDDIVMAYRMDVAYEDNPSKWYSLHQRKNTYSWFDESGAEHPVKEMPTDEGYVELAIIEDPEIPNKVFVPETLVRWEGWSLSVTRPGLAINDSEEHPAANPKDRHDFLHDRVTEMRKYHFDPSVNFKVNAQAGIVPNTLPKLRFGKSYRVRVRTVDLAGNSVPLNFESESASETTCPNIKYLRYEPLVSPLLLAGNNLRDGEFIEQMVIRSNYDKSSNKYENKVEQKGAENDGSSTRYILPPKSSQLMAETHGYFEKAFSDPQKAKDIYDIITSHEGLYQHGQNNEELIYNEDNAKVIYLPDPMAAGIALFADDDSDNTHTQDFFSPRMFSFFSKDEIKPGKTNDINIPEDWYNAPSIIIKLEEGKLDTDWSGKKRTFTVSLPKGHRLRIKISTIWREDDLKNLSAVWQLIQQGGATPETQNIALSGQHWMVSPSRTIDLVHAVQQPVDEPVLQKVISERDYGDTSALLNARFTVHGESTDFAQIQARWTEKYDDAISVDIKDKNFQYIIPDIDVYYHDKLITLGNVPEFRPDLNLDKVRRVDPLWKSDANQVKKYAVQPGSEKISALYSAQAGQLASVKKQKSDTQLSAVSALRLDIMESKFNLVKLLDLRNYPVEHPFGDTHHRWVDYTVVGTSRYTEYFAKLKKQDPGLPFSRDSKPQKVNILSTARPVKPEVEYIIPAFEWQKTSEGARQVHVRKGGVLRVYMKRPWFSSGDDEKLAVILSDSSKGGKNSLFLGATPNSSYSDIYTHWAADPILVSDLPGNTSPQPSDFRLNPVIDEGLIYPDKEGVKATAVAYPVAFDREKQLWYADIALNTANMYFPFIKMALARYQQHSLREDGTDVCLSPVVMSSMIQMVPERTASVELKQDGAQVYVEVKVKGPVYNQSSSHLGSIIKFTLLDNTYSQFDSGVKVHENNRLNSLLNSGNNLKEFFISRDMKGDDFFEMTKRIDIDETYKTRPFQIVIEEIEETSLGIEGVTDKVYVDRIQKREEMDRVVYVDVFNVNFPDI